MTSALVDPVPSPWGVLPRPGPEPTAVQVGPLVLQFLCQDDELWIAHHRIPQGGSPADTPAKEPAWQRWALPGGPCDLRLVPILPDRPVVVAPEQAFHVAPEASARIFVRLPVWVRVDLPRDPETTLLDVPSSVLSDTWWGDFLDGELCYWLPTAARRTITPELTAPSLVICPIDIRNDSDELLRVQKLAVRVVHLSVFALGDGLWADRTRVLYEGEDEGSHITTSGEPPAEAPGARLVTPARIPASKGLRSRTFAVLRSISGL